MQYTHSRTSTQIHIMYPKHEFCQLVIWSDNCGGQFRNKMNLRFLETVRWHQCPSSSTWHTWHTQLLLTKLGWLFVSAIWNFFVKGHGKSFCDQHFGCLFEIVRAYEAILICVDYPSSTLHMFVPMVLSTLLLMSKLLTRHAQTLVHTSLMMFQNGVWAGGGDEPCVVV